ncbi:DUF1194 domain-containing protein [Primorskyibacter sp. 2E107]|uniref:DUF1194 domain-containing protein n=1 Tax=Primorskyibacter sp. 2E107 TaxID=3403458 RepID=UPI003AF83ECF
MRRLLAGLLLLWAGGAEAACRQALALGLDVSGSVDAQEYRLQLDGLAAALETPEVVAAFLAMPDAPVRLAVFEWSGQFAQRGLQDWVTVTDVGVLADVAERLRGTARVAQDPSTALGEAKRYGAALLAPQAGCWRRVLDLSGDGESNTGPRPQDVRPGGVTINALVVTGSEPEALVSYFRAYVIEGEQAFVETALGFADFEAAMVRKLKRELQVMVLSGRR